MSGQDGDFEDFQKNGMNQHDSYLDLSKYENILEINEEIEQLQQDIGVRRRARQRLGVTEDDEAILMIDEKIKLLNAEKKLRRPKERYANWFTGICMFIVFGLPFFILIPMLWLIPAVVVAIIILRKVLRKRKAAASVKEVKSESVQTLRK